MLALDYLLWHFLLYSLSFLLVLMLKPYEMCKVAQSTFIVSITYNRKWLSFIKLYQCSWLFVNENCTSCQPTNNEDRGNNWSRKILLLQARFMNLIFIRAEVIRLHTWEFNYKAGILRNKSKCMPSWTVEHDKEFWLEILGSSGSSISNKYWICFV